MQRQLDQSPEQRPILQRKKEEEERERKKREMKMKFYFLEGFVIEIEIDFLAMCFSLSLSLSLSSLVSLRSSQKRSRPINLTSPWCCQPDWWLVYNEKDAEGFAEWRKIFLKRVPLLCGSVGRRRARRPRKLNWEPGTDCRVCTNRKIIKKNYNFHEGNPNRRWSKTYQMCFSAMTSIIVQPENMKDRHELIIKCARQSQGLLRLWSLVSCDMVRRSKRGWCQAQIKP